MYNVKAQIVGLYLEVHYGPVDVIHLEVRLCDE